MLCGRIFEQHFICWWLSPLVPSASTSTSKIVFVIWIVSISGFRQSTPHRSTIGNFNSFQFNSVPSKSRIIQGAAYFFPLGPLLLVVLLLFFFFESFEVNGGRFDGSVRFRCAMNFFASVCVSQQLCYCNFVTARK